MLSAIKNIAPLALYFLGIAIFLLSITGRVKYGLWFLIPLIPLQNIMEKIQQFPLGKDFNDILLIGMVIGWFFYKNSRRQPLFAKSAYNKIFLFYLIFSYFTLWHGSSFLGFPAPISPSDPRVQNWKNYMLLPLLFLITFNNSKDAKELKRLFIAMCLSIFLMNLYMLRQISWMGSWISRARIRGTFVWLGANEVAAFYATYTFVLIGIFLLVKDKMRKIMLTILIFQNLYCNLFLFSRGAYLATLVGFFLIALLRKRVLLIPLVLLLIYWQAILPQRVIERIQFTEREGQLDQSAQIRVVLWKQSIGFFKESPLVGIGFNAFQHFGLQRDVHNVYLRTLAEQGIIGLGFLLTIMLLALKKGFNLYRKANDKFLKGLGLGFTACVLAVMVGNLFGDRWTHLPLGAYFWVFLGMVERGNALCIGDHRRSHLRHLR
jgi:O-antigen ligase